MKLESKSGLIGSWDKNFIEHPMPGLSRTLGPVIHNYIRFFEKGNRYVTLSADLSAMGFPSKYRVIYYALVSRQDGRDTLDFSSWVDIPQPKLSLVSPNPIILTKGGHEIVGVQLKSSTGFIPNVTNFVPIERSSTIGLTFNPNKPYASSYEPATFKIDVPDHTPVGKYEIPVLANISTTESNFPNIFGINYIPPTKSYTLKNVNLSIMCCRTIKLWRTV